MKSHATLYVQLGRQVSTSLDYNAAKLAMSAQCRIDGFVWNAEDSGPLFQGASVHVTFIAGIDDRMKKYADEHGLAGVCGNIEISKNLTAETFEDSDTGETVVMPKITIWVRIDWKEFKLIQSTLVAYSEREEQSSMTIHFGHRNFTRIFTSLENLDLSEKTHYPIISFNVASRNAA